MKKINTLSTLVIALFAFGCATNASAAAFGMTGNTTGLAQQAVTTNLQERSGVATEVSLTPKVSAIAVGQKQKLTLNLPESTPANARTWWHSSQPNVATVSSEGVATGQKTGIVIITAISSNGKGAVATVRVESSNVPAAGIEITPSATTVAAGKTQFLSATVTPANASNKFVTWSSSNTDILSVNSAGLITGQREGTATVTATTHNGISQTVTVTVLPGVIDVSQIHLAKTALIQAAYTGTTHQTEATVMPEHATDKSLSWQSSNPAVATVDSTGLISFKRSGWVTITAKATNGVCNSLSFIVTPGRK